MDPLGRRSPLPPGERLRALLLIGFLLVVIGAATRVAIAASNEQTRAAAVLARALGVGAVQDALVALVLLAPLGVGLAWSSAARPVRPLLRFALLASLFGGAVFLAQVEYFFFEEFDARFNHVALDYVLFPNEVAGNLWESYPIPLHLLASAAAGAALAYMVMRALRGASRVELSLPRRLLATAAALGVAALAGLTLAGAPRPTTGDRRRDELEANGLVQLARAFESASLDYEDYYRTVPSARLEALSEHALGPKFDADGQRELRAVERRARPLDVVVVLGESFGSEFVGRLGGRKPNAPGFERWAQRGLLLTNLVATGNRTVRGLEGVLCSFLPLPGDSIWKRPQARGVATLAGVLGERGYRTEFVYGGDGAFDRMRDFALANGWQQFHDDSLLGGSSFPRDAFRTIWGVADESTFDLLLARQQAAERDGTPLFATALTVSNHKPYVNPDSRELGLRRGRLAWSAAGGIALAAAIWLARGRLRDQFGTARVTTACIVLAVAYGAWAWTRAQPHDSRESAVRYADRALAGYLDRAQAAGLLEHTVVLFVGDHGARVYGAEEIPAASYRIPALFVAPEERYHGATIERLCSQIDLAPTLLSLAGVDARAPFFGTDLLRAAPDAPGRAFLIHNRDVGMLTDTRLTVLGLQRTVTQYERTARDSDAFVRVDPAACDASAADAAAAAFQRASGLFESGCYRLRDGP